MHNKIIKSYDVKCINLCCSEAVLPGSIFGSECTTTTLLRIVQNNCASTSIPSPCHFLKWHWVWKPSHTITEPPFGFDWKILIFFAVQWKSILCQISKILVRLKKHFTMSIQGLIWLNFLYFKSPDLKSPFIIIKEGHMQRYSYEN